MNENIVVDRNLEVSIDKIQQFLTYVGLLEGLPTAEMNHRILTRTMKEAKEFCGIDEIYLIEPKQTPIPYDGKYPFGEPVALPKVGCIAELHYFCSFRDKTKYFSSLGLVWFQDDYAFPIDREILEKIKKIPFSEICGEFEW